jgi:hypothetical protein
LKFEKPLSPYVPVPSSLNVVLIYHPPVHHAIPQTLRHLASSITCRTGFTHNYPNYLDICVMTGMIGAGLSITTFHSSRSRRNLKPFPSRLMIHEFILSVEIMTSRRDTSGKREDILWRIRRTFSPGKSNSFLPGLWVLSSSPPY